MCRRFVVKKTSSLSLSLSFSTPFSIINTKFYMVNSIFRVFYCNSLNKVKTYGAIICCHHSQSVSKLKIRSRVLTHKKTVRKRAITAFLRYNTNNTLSVFMRIAWPCDQRPVTPSLINFSLLKTIDPSYIKILFNAL